MGNNKKGNNVCPVCSKTYLVKRRRNTDVGPAAWFFIHDVDGLGGLHGCFKRFKPRNRKTAEV